MLHYACFKPIGIFLNLHYPPFIYQPYDWIGFSFNYYPTQMSKINVICCLFSLLIMFCFFYSMCITEHWQIFLGKKMSIILSFHLALIMYISHVNNWRNTAAIEDYHTIGSLFEQRLLSSFSVPGTTRNSRVSELLDYIQIIKSCARWGMSQRRTWNQNTVLLRDQVKNVYVFCV